MKAIKLGVRFDDRRKQEDLLNEVGSDEIITYGLTNNTAIIVTEGECGMAWIKARIVDLFEDADVEVIR